MRRSVRWPVGRLIEVLGVDTVVAILAVVVGPDVDTARCWADQPVVLTDVLVANAMTSSTRSIRARSSMRNSLGPSQRPDPGRRPTPIPAWSPVPRAARHDDRSIRGEFRIFARTAQSGIRRLGPGSSARSMLPRSVTLTQWHGVSPSGSTIRATASVAATPTAGAGELRWAGPSSGGFRPGRSGFTTRTMPWPPGSKVATKGHRPGSAATPDHGASGTALHAGMQMIGRRRLRSSNLPG